MKITVLSIFRNAERHIQETFKRLEALENDNPSLSFEYFFYENDSTDNTAMLLNKWMAGRKGKVITEILGKDFFKGGTSSKRMKILTYARNKGLKSAKPLYSDYTFIFDSDIEFSSSIINDYIQLFEEYPDAVMLTPNVLQNIKCQMCDCGKDSYYDSWALLDSRGNNGFTWACCPFQGQKDIDLWEANKLVPVRSAFGGAVLVKSEAMNNVNWSTDGKCEHWNFCGNLSKYGKVYVCPTIIVRTEIEQEIINGIPKRHMKTVAEHQKQRMWYDKLVFK